MEPGAFAYGNTIVTAFQVARISSGGGADIGFATSKDGGQTWTNGLLPGLTQCYQGGTNSAASDASVAYDAKHGMWLISTLPIGNNDSGGDQPVHRRPDLVQPGAGHLQHQLRQELDHLRQLAEQSLLRQLLHRVGQPWLGDVLYMSTSSDGGATWGPAKRSASQDSGIGGQPLVLPNGTVVVSYADFNGGMSAYTLDQWWRELECFREHFQRTEPW